jgi:hypothetical protein
VVRFERDDEATDGSIEITWDAELLYPQDAWKAPTLSIEEQ